MNNSSICVLAGGVGAARFLQGLVCVTEPNKITVISNVGDDVDLYGLRVCPDIDIVIYTLAGLVNPELGWGLFDDSFTVLKALKNFGYEDWFNLGDRDLATSIHRTRLLSEGVPLHEVVKDLVASFSLDLNILPATNQRISTLIETKSGMLSFQDYMVRLRGTPEVTGVRFSEIDQAVPAPGVLEAINDASMIVLAPSNPFLSIEPILAVAGVRHAIKSSAAPVVAISPIVGGAAIKGPAARLLQSLGHEVSALGVARIYANLVDHFCLDEVDRELEASIAALGLNTHVTNTIMTSQIQKNSLAREVIESIFFPQADNN
tara:strand:+ start:698 stop:1654 length:957 start_codon:yes stop_codon:yes gene_type:complete